MHKWIDSDTVADMVRREREAAAIRAAAARLRLPTDNLRRVRERLEEIDVDAILTRARERALADGISGGGRWDDAAGQVLDEHHEAWQALADGAIGGRVTDYERSLLTYSEWLRLATRRDLTSGG